MPEFEEVFENLIVPNAEVIFSRGTLTFFFFTYQTKTFFSMVNSKYVYTAYSLLQIN